MARKTPSRMELRRQQEALEAQGGAEAAPKKAKKEKAPKAEKAPKKPATRTKKTKEKALVRKRLVWVVYSPGMKEEGRFDYDKRDDAEKKVEALKEKHKKPYFIQGVKEVLDGGGVAVVAHDDEPPAPRKARPRPVVEEDDEPVERDDDDD
jgi:hypothetical protein